MGVFVLLLGLLYGLDRASVHAFAGNSDGATVILEGVAMSHGRLALSGWDLSNDSFWSVDASIYALGALVFGLSHDLLHVVPAFLALSWIVLGVVAVAGRRRSLAAVAGVLFFISVLGMPSPMFSFFLLQGPWHIGTALWCLLAFFGASRGRFGAAWAIAVLFIAMGLLGDLQTLFLGVVPLVAAGLTAMARKRSVRAGLSTLTAGIAGALLALAVRSVMVRIGTFALEHSYTRAKSAQYYENLHLIAKWGAALLGVGRIPINPTQALGPYETTRMTTFATMLHAVALAVVVAGVLCAVASLLHGAVRGRDRRTEGGDAADESFHLDDLLVFGVAGSLAIFVYLCPNGNGDYARYLTPAVLFSALLASRWLAHHLDALARPTASRVVVVAVGLIVVLSAVQYTTDLSSPAAPQPAIALGAFLSSHHLTVGIGDYWSSSLVTVVTDGRVLVRPVIPALNGSLVRYGRQTDAAWYVGTRFQFLVYDTGREWRNVNSVSASSSFGPPKVTYSVGTYRVLVWPRGVSVSATGFSRH
jgi:hypothetical protein